MLNFMAIVYMLRYLRKYEWRFGSFAQYRLASSLINNSLIFSVKLETVWTFLIACLRFTHLGLNLY